LIEEYNMPDFKQFVKEQFLSLETFRKNGEGVKTPIWFVQDGEDLLLWTVGESAKIKRIRNNPQVKIAPCQRFGEVTGTWVPARASVDESPAAVKHVEKLLVSKIGLGFVFFRLIDQLRDRQRGSHRVCLRLTLV
jgi:uncharacterized protein